ncbi:MAG: glutamine--fructose-6-phosphate aminotransferase, partial [Verrucomicrobiota bacterium]
MCGIIGYVGKASAAPVLLDGLRRLEYRGYDSSGLAVMEGSLRGAVRQRSGRVVRVRVGRGGARG